MAVSSQYKVNQLAKDLSLKTKDLTDIMAAAGFEVKTQKALEPFELDVIWEVLTTSNQIVGIEDYIDGVTGIPSLRKKAAETKPAEKAKAEKPAETKAPKSAEKKPEKKAEAQPAPKAEVNKPEEKKAEEKKPAEKPQEKQNVARSAGERFESRMSAANEKSKQEKTEKKQEKPQEKKSGRTAIDMRASARPEGEREVVTVSPKAATRVVDTRGSGAVDLSKYEDTTLDNIVPENIREERGGSQKVKKSPAAQNAEKEGTNQKGQKKTREGSYRIIQPHQDIICQAAEVAGHCPDQGSCQCTNDNR